MVPMVDLTPDEHRILRMISFGHPQEEVAKHCHWSVRTVKTKLASARNKLGTTSTVYAVAIAIRKGII